MDSKQPRLIATPMYEKDENGEYQEAPGGWSDKQRGCICVLVRQRHAWDREDVDGGYYGHAQAIAAGGKTYYVTIINEACPLHGNNPQKIEVPHG